MIETLLKKYVLPKETDFLKSLQEQALAIRSILEDLYSCFIVGEKVGCQAIIDDEHRAGEIKSTNMKELLDAFITPFDRESIYRVVTQLDWIAVSVRHFILEAHAYEVEYLADGYEHIFTLLKQAAHLLESGFSKLGRDQINEVTSIVQEVRDTYNKIIEEYVVKMAQLSQKNDMHAIFIERELLLQLKEVGKRFRVCADSLEDIVIKMG